MGEFFQVYATCHLLLTERWNLQDVL
jgi:hypothetical protein